MIVLGIFEGKFEAIELLVCYLHIIINRLSNLKGLNYN